VKEQTCVLTEVNLQYCQALNSYIIQWMSCPAVGNVSVKGKQSTGGQRIGQGCMNNIMHMGGSTCPAIWQGLPQQNNWQRDQDLERRENLFLFLPRFLRPIDPLWL
jgi:hypothetical protein